MWKYTRLFRSPDEIHKLKRFFVEHHTKTRVIQSLATGFKSEFEYSPPAPWGHVSNYGPVNTKEGSIKLREAMKEQVLQGKMIGGPGWSIKDVKEFFGGREWYGVPCGAVEKEGDPLGRIVHDYGFYRRGSYSINAAHANTSVKYDSIRRRAVVLDRVI